MRFEALEMLRPGVMPLSANLLNSMQLLTVEKDGVLRALAVHLEKTHPLVLAKFIVQGQEQGAVRVVSRY